MRLANPGLKRSAKAPTLLCARARMLADIRGTAGWSEFAAGSLVISAAGFSVLVVSEV